MLDLGHMLTKRASGLTADWMFEVSWSNGPESVEVKRDNEGSKDESPDENGGDGSSQRGGVNQ